MTSNKDEIILRQMDIISSMARHNLQTMADDFWGAPSKVKENKPQEDNKPKTQAATPETPNEAKEELPPKEDIEELKKELNEYIGLENIKKEVKSLINMVTVHKMRKDNGLKTVDMSLHMVFSGNPGTGKTMLARLMARIYHSLDILSKGQLVEVDRAQLVAGYVGQTAIKTKEVCEKAIGGVLFIDEAYTLTSKSGNDFGQEAVDTILKMMEDNRNDLVVIVAGYDELMDEFVHSNPGLESRFNRFMHFEDYTPEELVDIFKSRMEKSQYKLGNGAEQVLREVLAEENKDPMSFGNARGVRNIFELSLVNQCNRLAETAGEISKDMLMTIEKEDLKNINAQEDDDLKQYNNVED